MIKDLKKNDKFLFNDKTYIVVKKYRNDNSPLKAVEENSFMTSNIELFHYDELEIEKL